jgi:hypothetical protein
MTGEQTGLDGVSGFHNGATEITEANGEGVAARNGPQRTDARNNASPFTVVVPVSPFVNSVPCVPTKS